jgi:hypothetical protein
MSIEQYVLRKQDRLWEVWLGRRLLTGQPTYEEALNFAEAQASAAVQRGEPARIMIDTFDGVAVEFQSCRRRAGHTTNACKASYAIQGGD